MSISESAMKMENCGCVGESCYFLLGWWYMFGELVFGYCLVLVFGAGAGLVLES